MGRGRGLWHPVADPLRRQCGAVFMLSDLDLHLFNEGTHYRLWEKLGSRMAQRDGVDGVAFAVWAPNAQRVSVVGDFNGWQPQQHPLEQIQQSGVWAGFIAGLGKGTRYKYHIESRFNGYRVDKADPFAHFAEIAPNTASIVHPLDYQWHDQAWMNTRKDKQRHDQPVTIYEMHMGSWRRDPAEPGRLLSYNEIARDLPAYLIEHGFTHVEFLPIMEHPLFRSWGYQTTGYFGPCSRYGAPQDLMFLIDTLHRAGIGVILDWVPSHFPSDEHALGYFDGTHLFEHEDPRQGFHPDWKSLIFNYERHEVRSFLISSAMFWLEVFHADGLRVDAVASMLYLDYSREDGAWIPNKRGGRENLDAIDFLQKLNTEVGRVHPDALTFAEESTDWPGVTRPVHEGGLGFDFKWDMGWMNDTLRYLARDPIDRKHHHHELTFRSLYMHAEKYLLPLSHDEVVHGKGSLVNKMPGDAWQRFANLRLLLALQWLSPGKKLLFMGSEIGAVREWNEEESIDWHLADEAAEHPAANVGLHAGVRRLVEALNRLYRYELALHQRDDAPAGFAWIDADDANQSVFTFLRKGADEHAVALCAINATPVVRYGVPAGVPDITRLDSQPCQAWREVLNTDAAAFGGSGVGNLGSVAIEYQPHQSQPSRLLLTLPPLAAVVLVPER